MNPIKKGMTRIEAEVPIIMHSFISFARLQEERAALTLNSSL